MALQPGQLVDGKYRIERLLGAGGMGAVFAARHLELDDLVAIKVMLPEVEGALGAKRFEREARAARRLRGEHVVRVLDAGRLVDRSRYIVFEHIEGKDLQRISDERGPMPVAEACALIIQACAGAAEAHAHGMVHRDLALKNMLLTAHSDGSPLVKILDFGVVKWTEQVPRESEELTLTASDSLVGSVHYMAPEQVMMSSKVDARADVWSLGVCLYVLLTGVHPFDGDTVVQILASITGRPPRSLREERADVPVAISDAVERALERSLQRRFQTVADLAGALGAAIGDESAGPRVAAIVSKGTPGLETAALPSPDDARDETTTLPSRGETESIPAIRAATLDWAAPQPSSASDASALTEEAVTRTLTLREPATPPVRRAPTPTPIVGPVETEAPLDRQAPPPTRPRRARVIGATLVVAASLGLVASWRMRGSADLSPPPAAEESSSMASASAVVTRSAPGSPDFSSAPPLLPTPENGGSDPGLVPASSSHPLRVRKPAPSADSPRPKAKPASAPTSAPSSAYDSF